VKLCDVEAFVDDLGDGFDLCAQFGLDFVQGEPVLVGDKVDGHAKVTEPSRPADPVQVGLCHLGKVEVDDHVDGLDVNASSQEVGADQVSAQAGPEVVEDSVPVVLGHPRVDVVAAVAEVSNLFGQQLHTLRRVAENDALIDL